MESAFIEQDRQSGKKERMKERKNKRKKERIKERKQERMIERNTDTANTECEGTLQSDTDRISIHRAR